MGENAAFLHCPMRDEYREKNPVQTINQPISNKQTIQLIQYPNTLYNPIIFLTILKFLSFNKKDKLYKQTRFVFIMVENETSPETEVIKPEEGEEALKEKAEKLAETGK